MSDKPWYERNPTFNTSLPVCPWCGVSNKTYEHSVDMLVSIFDPVDIQYDPCVCASCGGKYQATQVILFNTIPMNERRDEHRLAS